MSFREAVRFWAKLGLISFGGPAGQIAIMHRELVDRRQWVSETRFLHALNYCMLLPGPEAQQLATYLGWRLHRVRGGLAAGALFVLPSALLLFGLSWVYAAYGELPAAAGLLAGFKAVVVAIVADALLRMGHRMLRGPAHFLVAGGAFAGIYFAGIPFPLIVIAAAVLGVIVARVWPAALGQPTPQEATAAGPAPSGLHAAPSKARLLRVIVAGLLLWALPGLVLIICLGADSLSVRQYGFFTGAALVTFGGAYAVLAYVLQAAVQTYGWISPAQAVDGLALAETTPGPLLMVLQFVGFMTGWNHPGHLGSLASATLGAVVTTWATFLPSFVFIFAGAPYIEVLSGHRVLRTALSGVTASVIGSILSLALIFGEAVVLPGGLGGGIDWFALTVAIAAFAALNRFKVGPVWAVLAGGLAGLMRSLMS